MTGIIIATAVVFIRIVQLQIAPADDLMTFTPRTYSDVSEEATRGDLLDRRGRVIATSRFGRRLFADPSLLEDPYEISLTLAERLNLDPVEIDKRLQARLETRYVILVPLLTDQEVVAMQSGESIPGIGLEPVAVRHRPYGDLAAALIGKVGVDRVGLSGMERVLNSYLTGQPGELHYLRDVRRRAMWVEPVGYRPAEDGESLRLSIDMEIQRIAEEELAASVEKFNAGGGRVVVIDPQTGELLAMCSMLRDKPGVLPFAVDPLRQQDPALGRLRCASDPYEPGSTFKPFVWSSATELGVTRAEEVFNTYDGLYRSTQGRRIRDSHPYSELRWDMVLIKSSNIGMAQAAERMTPKQMQEAIQRFGFGQATGCGLPGETAGIVTRPADWNHYTQTSVSFGQEIAVTPLQMVRAFSAFARDGTIPTLRTLAVDQGPFAEHDESPSAWVERRAIAESVALQTRYVLHRVMTEGTGRLANDGAKYRMFAKSGTAEMPDRVNGGYYENRYIGNFIAGAPLESPRLVVLCVIEDPDKSISHWGGVVAGPVVCNILNRALEYLGVRSDLDDDESPV